MATPRTRGNLGPVVVLVIAAVAVFAVAAFGTAHDWFAFATGHVYRVTGPVAAAAVSPGPSGSAAVGPSDQLKAAGYEDGYADGKKAAYSRGVKKGRHLGFQHGFAVGKHKGYHATFASGEHSGYAVGLKEGRKAGHKKLERQFLAWEAAQGG